MMEIRRISAPLSSGVFIGSCLNRSDGKSVNHVTLDRFDPATSSISKKVSKENIFASDVLVSIIKIPLHFGVIVKSFERNSYFSRPVCILHTKRPAPSVTILLVPFFVRFKGFSAPDV